MRLPKPASIALILSTPGYSPTEVHTWQSAASVFKLWLECLPAQEYARPVKVRATMEGGLVLEIAISPKAGEVPELEWEFAQALSTALGYTPSPTAERVTLHSFNWKRIAEAAGMRLGSLREGEVVLRQHPVGGHARTFRVVDNGGEFCVYEERLTALTNGLPYASASCGKVGDLTTAYRLRATVEREEINWALDLDAE
jgi:hypothetical protein